MRYMDDKDKGCINLSHKLEDVEIQKFVDVCAWDFLKWFKLPALLLHRSIIHGPAFLEAGCWRNLPPNLINLIKEMLEMEVRQVSRRHVERKIALTVDSQLQFVKF